jgi:hypothetical protein
VPLLAVLRQLRHETREQEVQTVLPEMRFLPFMQRTITRIQPTITTGTTGRYEQEDEDGGEETSQEGQPHEGAQEGVSCEGEKEISPERGGHPGDALFSF